MRSIEFSQPIGRIPKRIGKITILMAAVIWRTVAYFQNWCGILENLQLAFPTIPASIFNLHLSLFQRNPYFAAADEQQDDGYGAVSLDYEDGSKAQWTEEDMFRWQIKREIKNRLWPESSMIPKERGAVGGPEAIAVPWSTQGFLVSGENGYLFSGSWGALVIIFRDLGSKLIVLGI